MTKQNILWIFDFDGTLATLRHTYRASRLDPDCEEMLILLIQRFPGRVAVISSRPLQDLEPRIPVPGLFLVGSGGLTWLLPGGEKKIFHSIFDKHLNKAREAALPRIKELELLYGVDTEDKLASYTLHIPHLAQQTRQCIVAAIQNLGEAHACEVFQGPESVDIYFLPSSIRLGVISTFCSLLALDPEAVEIIYAGNGKTDIPVFQWVLGHGGTAYTVGGMELVPGACIKKNPQSLAQDIIRLCHGNASSAPRAVA